MNDLCRKLVRLVWSFKHGFEGGRFLRTMYQKHDPRRAVQNRRRQSNAIGIQLADPVAGHQTLFFVQRLCTRKERSGMPFGTHSEQYQIETRKLTRLQLERGPQLLSVFFRRVCDVRVLTVNAVHLLWPHRSPRKHRFRGHAKVALGMIGRYVPFITEKELNLVPRNFRLKQRVACQESVKHLRCGTARERDRERVFLPDGFLRCLQKLCGGGLRDRIGIRQYFDFSIGRHCLNAPRRSPAPPSPEPRSAQTTHTLLRLRATHARPASADHRLLTDPNFPRRSSENVRPAQMTTHPVLVE